MQTKSIVVSTKDYEKFKLVSFNRSIKPKNVERLMKSFNMTGGMSISKPIIVDENFVVIDGQHRLEACKRLGIPVHYIIANESPDRIPIYNTYQEKWGLEDYANYWAYEGNENYKRILEVKEKTGVSLAGCIECLCFSMGGHNDDFKEGRFTFTKDIDESVEYVKKIMQLHYLIKGKRVVTTKITRAIRFLSRIKSFNLDTLINKMERYQAKLHPCVTSEEYIELFVTLYNYKIQLNRISSLDILAAKNS